MKNTTTAVSRFRFAFSRFAILGALLLVTMSAFAAPADSPELMPLGQVKPGMKAVAYTIFSGDQIEKFDMVVLGILPDLLGPHESIILVQLVGPKVEHTGVVAGMSGSPVYIDGKLVGALALKFGSFTKEALGGVTPIENMMEVTPPAARIKPAKLVDDSLPHESDEASASQPRYELSSDVVERGTWLKGETGAHFGGAYLTPIETPLVFSGIYPSVLAHFAPELSGYGLVAVSGGAGKPQPDDANIVPGDMVSVMLVSGDMTAAASCTVTAIVQNRIYACGHPIFGLGDVSFPLARGRVVATMSSQDSSTKIVTTGGIIGTLSADRLSAIMGTSGAGPKMISMDMSLQTPAGERKSHYELAENKDLTPLLVGIVAQNGLTSNNFYSDGNTLRLSGEIKIAGHSSIQLENMFAPGGALLQDSAIVTGTVQQLFSRVFTNPYEQPKIEHIQLNLESIPERRFTAIEGAWTDATEVVPGQTVQVKVLLRSYRGSTDLRTIPITIPSQVDRGVNLRILVSDSLNADRTLRPISPQASANQAGGLEQYIRIVNRERRNNRLYVTLLQPTTTLLLEDKELPNVPLSAANVLNQRRGEPNATMLRESLAGEWSLPTEGVISGTVSLSVRVK
jgi:SpoIVB peptidase S55